MCARPDCGHPRAIHVGSGCRIGGCPCTGFDDGKKQPAGPRRVAIDVPDGYMLSITLTPWDPEVASEEAVASALASVEDSGAEAAS
jgi:hypothetical protein